MRSYFRSRLPASSARFLLPRLVLSLPPSNEDSECENSHLDRVYGVSYGQLSKAVPRTFVPCTAVSPPPTAHEHDDHQDHSTGLMAPEPHPLSCAAAVRHRTSDQGSSRSSLPSSPPCCLHMCATIWRQRWLGSRRYFSSYVRRLALFDASTRCSRRAPTFMVTVRGSRRGIAAATCHANKDTRCDSRCSPADIWPLLIGRRKAGRGGPLSRVRKDTCP
jgi:hypothetical protein